MVFLYYKSTGGTVLLRKRILCLIAWPALLAASSLDYQKTFGGNGAVSIAAVATDAAGNVYIAGTTTAFDFPVKNAYQPRNPGTAAVVSRDAGQTWSPLGFIPDIPYTGVEAPAADPANPNILIASGVYGVYRSTDAGATWKTVVDLNVDRARIGYVDRVQYDPRNPSTVYVSATAGVLKSIDTGVTWTLLSNGIEAGNCCTGAGLAVDPFVAQRVVFTINERAYVSLDGGASWSRLALPPGSDRPLVAMDPFVAGTWYEYDYAAAYRSEDAGASWTRLPLDSTLFGWILPDPSVPGRLYAKTAEGMWRSADRGRTWTALVFPETSPKLGGVNAFQIQPGNPNWLVAAGTTSDGMNDICLFSKDGGQTWQPMGAVRPFWEFRFDPSQPNVLYGAGSPTSDVFVAKLDPAGDIVFSTYLGGQGNDSAFGLALDASGNIYVAGTTESTDFPGATTRLYHGLSPSLFAAKLDPTGRPVQATLFGDAGSYVLSGFARDADGNLLLSGFASSPVFPATANALGQFGTGWSGFAAKLSADGTGFVYSTALAGTPTSIAADPAGNFLVSGDFLDPRFPGDGGANLLKFSPSGSLLYATLLPVAVGKVATDASGNIYVAGNASVGDSAPITAGAFQGAIDTSCPNNSGGYFSRPADRLAWMTDVYLAKLDAQASSVKFATFLGGSCRDTVSDMALGADGSVYVTGDTYSDPFPALGSVFGPPPQTPKPFVTHLDATGSKLLFSSYLDFGTVTSIAPDGAGNVYVAENVPKASYVMPTAAVLAKLATAPSAAPAPRQVVDAFSRANVTISPQEIVVVEMPGFQPASAIDLGLQPVGGAPLQLGGVSVEFNGVAAAMLAVRAGEIECVTPVALAGQSLAAVQVVNAGARSGVLNVDVAPISPAFYQVRNWNGTVNSPDNLAPAGTEVTFLFTGAGLPNPGASAIPLPLTFQFTPVSPQGTVQVTIGDVSAAPGFVTGLAAAKVRVPSISGAVTVQMFPAYPTVFPYPQVYPAISISVGATPPRRPLPPPR
jgi:uncharacterized protein (TIGR03437 family)